MTAPKIFALACVPLLTTVAWAQPADAEDPLGTPGNGAATEPAPPPVQEPPPPPPEPPVEVAPVPSTGRPEGLTIGIGIGYVFPTSIENPNTASVRFRLASGLIFEPSATLGRTAETEDDGMSDEQTTRTELSVGTLVRKPFRTRGKLDLELIASAGISTATVDPDGPSNVENTTTFGVGWGLGITYWLTRNWALSTTATNPLLAYTRIKSELGMIETTRSSNTFVLTWDPTIAVMMHLFH